MSQKDDTPHPATIAVVGLGLLGRGIATCFLGHGFRVVGCERAAEARAIARAYIERGLREMVEHADFDAAVASDWQDRYHQTDRFDDWPQCDFVIESIIEDQAAKHAVFDEIERVVAPSVPIASNTSAIPITVLQDARRHPERFLGMHWFEPAHITRFLEIVPGERTTASAIETAVRLARRCGRDPSMLAKDIPGFIVNRLAYALYREALHLIELGVADAETIDRSFRNSCGVWSTIFGPFQWIDLTGGPALYGACMERILPTLSNATELPEPIRRLAAEGAQGVANGRGFYYYTTEQAKQVDELFHAHAWKARRTMDEYFPVKEEQ